MGETCIMAESKKPVMEEITGALVELMAEKPFADITVTDVVKRAGVARASFYRNFSSTNEILDELLNELVRAFSEHVLPIISSQDERTWRAFLFRYLYFIIDHQQKLLACKSPNLSLLLYKMSETAHEMSQNLQFNSIKEKFSIPARIGVINSVVLRWIDDGQKETPEEIVNYLMPIILSI